ncbi:MAG: hypothetical protein ACLP1X_05050 [Polyangiaceae bacterium]
MQDALVRVESHANLRGAISDRYPRRRIYDPSTYMDRYVLDHDLYPMSVVQYLRLCDAECSPTGAGERRESAYDDRAVSKVEWTIFLDVPSGDSLPCAPCPPMDRPTLLDLAR